MEFRYVSFENIAHVVAQDIFQRMKEKLVQQPLFRLGLSGGDSPKKLYQQLAKFIAKEGREFHNKIHYILVDERYVERENPLSNFGMIHENLFSQLAHYPQPFQILFPDTSKEKTTLLTEWEEKLKGDGSADLLILGVGSDGHTASLFPTHRHLFPQKNELTWITPETVNGAIRLTTTYHYLMQGKKIIFYLPGEAKKDIRLKMMEKDSSLIVSHLLENHPDITVYHDDILHRQSEAVQKS